MWGIFFSDENRAKWIDYLCWQHGLTPDQAELIFGRVCYLPASKRKPEDTYWTLAGTKLRPYRISEPSGERPEDGRNTGLPLEDYSSPSPANSPMTFLKAEHNHRLPDGYELNPNWPDPESGRDRRRLRHGWTYAGAVGGIRFGAKDTGGVQGRVRQIPGRILRLFNAAARLPPRW